MCQEVTGFFCTKRLGYFFCAERLCDFFVPRDCVIFSSSSPERLSDFFWLEKFRDIFWSKRFRDFVGAR